MSISKKWCKFSKENLREVPNFLGVYELADANKELIYIGEGRLKNRLLEHNRKKLYAHYYRYLVLGSKIRCEQKERAMQRAYRKKHGELPWYNKQLGDVL